MEPRAAVVVLIKTVVKQELQQLLVEVERIQRVVLVQLEIQVAQQPDLYLLMVHIYRAAHHVIKLIQKVVAAVVAVTTAAAAVHIKPQVVVQKMAAAAAVRAT
jgi:hypothetical protein